MNPKELILQVERSIQFGRMDDLQNVDDSVLEDIFFGSEGEEEEEDENEEKQEGEEKEEEQEVPRHEGTNSGGVEQENPANKRPITVAGPQQSKQRD